MNRKKGFGDDLLLTAADEFDRLRTRIKQLEAENKKLTIKVVELETFIMDHGIKK